MHAIDTEYEVAPVPVPRLVCVSIAGPAGCGVYHQSDPNALEVVRFALRTGWIGHTVPADIMAVGRRWPELWPEILDAFDNDRVIDVGSCDKLIVYAEGAFEKKFSLAAITMRRLGIELAKGADTWRLRYGELLDVPIAYWPAEATEYALKDPAVTYAAHIKQRQWGEVLAPATSIARKHLALWRQALTGMAVDPHAVAKLEARLDEEIRRHTATCLKHGLARPKNKKPGAAIQRSESKAREMFEALGIPLKRTNPSPTHPHGQISLGEDALKAAAIPPGHPLDAYRRLGSRQSQRTKFITPRRGPVVYTKYDELKITGRTGSAGYDDDDWRGACSDNLQNQPKEEDENKVPIFRVCHVPRPGRKYVVSDWGGAELVTLAQIQLDWFGRSRLADVLREGRNPHDELACTILDIDRSRFDKNNPEHKRARQLAKAPNFGYPGGLGAKRFIDYAAKEPYNLVISEAEAKRLKAQWLETWPEMKLYFEYITSLEDREGLITIKGPRFGIIRGGARFTEACNFPFQGLAAAAAGTALWWLFRAGFEPTSPMFDAYQVLFVHDENVTEAPEDRAELVLAEQERLMIEAFRQWCPDVPIKVESSIADRYSK